MKEEWSRLCEESAERNPRTAAIGLFSREEWAEGVGIFQWFEDFESAKFMISHIIPAIQVDPDEDGEMKQTYEATREALSAILKPVGKIEDFTPELVERLAEALGDQPILWIGTFEGLCSSDNEWCADLRESFRADDDDPSSEPIKKSEVKDFVEFVQTYGF
jgi:hypothetical protein